MPAQLGSYVDDVNTPIPKPSKMTSPNQTQTKLHNTTRWTCPANKANLGEPSDSYPRP
ncbi:uncharacterized protein RCO7_14620 [Rhynchosporium graminicola]|uniref:Uncharacterized protein n=1 Tax=Rhynchosporium graminicola TaxID=2792576 RepID=A0A1E1KS40_9HELO|nr:uncharacterized protein RCO7_14620 [Rhynchosporium commune]